MNNFSSGDLVFAFDDIKIIIAKLKDHMQGNQIRTEYYVFGFISHVKNPTILSFTIAHTQCRVDILFSTTVQSSQIL
mgnify:FL=1